MANELFQKIHLDSSLRIFFSSTWHHPRPSRAAAFAATIFSHVCNTSVQRLYNFLGSFVIITSRARTRVRVRVNVPAIFFPSSVPRAFVKYLRLTFQSIEIAFYGVVTVRAIICEPIVGPPLAKL